MDSMAARFIGIVNLWVLLAAPRAALAALTPGTPVTLPNLAQMQPNDMVIIIGQPRPVGPRRPTFPGFPAQLVIVRHTGSVIVQKGEMVRQHPYPFTCGGPRNISCDNPLLWAPAAGQPKKALVGPALADEMYWDLNTLWPLKTLGTTCEGPSAHIVTTVHSNLVGIWGVPAVIDEVNPIIVLWRGQVSGCMWGDLHTYAFQVNLAILRRVVGI
jgi:hypothetical protein